jgi:hypothetical protein
MSTGRAPSKDRRLYDGYLKAVQKLRSRIYRKDGAIQDWQIDSNGGYRMSGDDRSWHLLLIDGANRIAGCTRYLVHPNTITFEELLLRNASLSRDKQWGEKMRSAFETEIRLARAEGVPYVELGGWALEEEFRGTKAALKILLASYAWAKLLGGCRCACTATVRHGSASILRKIGGSAIELHGERLPTYNDPAYGCDMELLRFDWRYPNPRFLGLVNEIEEDLRQAPIITTSQISVSRNDPAQVLVA